MLLKTRCLVLDDALRQAFGFHGVASSFFMNVVGAVDCLLVAQINDEAADCLEKGGPRGELIASVVSEARDRGMHLDSIHRAVQGMESLFRNGTEFVVGSTYMDFIVSTFSAFEMFMARIYEPLRLEHPSSNSRSKHLKKLITKYNHVSDEEKEEVLARIAKVSDYVSGREKIEFVLSRQPKESLRDRAKDLLAVRFYSNTRNSIHNLGKSATRDDLEYSSDGIELTHNAGAAMFTADRSGIIRLCRELVEIYSDVVVENTALDPEVFLAVDVGVFAEEGFGS